LDGRGKQLLLSTIKGFRQCSGAKRYLQKDQGREHLVRRKKKIQIFTLRGDLIRTLEGGAKDILLWQIEEEPEMGWSWTGQQQRRLRNSQKIEKPQSKKRKGDYLSLDLSPEGKAPQTGEKSEKVLKPRLSFRVTFKDLGVQAKGGGSCQYSLNAGKSSGHAGILKSHPREFKTSGGEIAQKKKRRAGEENWTNFRGGQKMRRLLTGRT